MSSHAPGTYEFAGYIPAIDLWSQDWLTGPHYQAQPYVANDGAFITWRIVSDYGVWDVQGDERVIVLLREINAIATLKAESQTERYVSALKQAGKADLSSTRRLITDPLHTVKAVPVGVWHLAGKVGDTAQHVASGTAEKPGGGDALGLDPARRALAAQLGVNPYTRNAVLDHELQQSAWVSVSGKLTLKLVLTAAAPMAGRVLIGVTVADKLSNDQLKLPPDELTQNTVAKLVAQGVSQDAALALSGNPAYDPWSFASIAGSLTSLGRVTGVDAFVREAAMASNDVDSFSQFRVAQLMAAYHAKTSLIKLVEAKGRLVTFTDSRGDVVAPVWVDFVQWIVGVEGIVQRLQDLGRERNATKLIIICTGSLSNRTKTELTKRNIGYVERAYAGG